MPQIIHGLNLGAENSAALDFISTDCDAAIQQRNEGQSELQASQEYTLGLAGLPESARFTNDRRRLIMGVYTGYLVVSDYLSQLAELNLHRGEAGV